MRCALAWRFIAFNCFRVYRCNACFADVLYNPGLEYTVSARVLGEAVNRIVMAVSGMLTNLALLANYLLPKNPGERLAFCAGMA